METGLSSGRMSPLTSKLFERALKGWYLESTQQVIIITYIHLLFILINSFLVRLRLW